MGMVKKHVTAVMPKKDAAWAQSRRLRRQACPLASSATSCACLRGGGSARPGAVVRGYVTGHPTNRARQAELATAGQLDCLPGHRMTAGGGSYRLARGMLACVVAAVTGSERGHLIESMGLGFR
eukprot:351138-Chlamydomonas_euryale.AAC.19